MHRSSGIAPRVLLFVTIPLLLTLAACGGSKASSTSTLSVEEIFTSAAQTFDAQQATELASTPPTDTPLPPSPFPTLPPASPAGPLPTISFTSPTVAGNSVPGCDNAAWIADLTIPDGTRMDPNQNFTKKWRIQNTGACTWGSGYQLVFVDGTRMNAPTSVALSASVPPGQQTDLAIDMQAPDAYGDYKGTWQMQNAQGQSFGSQIWVSIKVRTGNLTDTPEPTATP